MNQPALAPCQLSLTRQQAEQAKQEAWDRFVADYIGCVDDDPGTARARWWAEMACIDALVKTEDEDDG